MGRIPSPEGRKYQIQHCWDIHHEICRLALLGMKHVEIAKTLGITPATVGNTLGSELVKKQMMILRGARDASSVDVAKKIQEMLPEALEVLETILKNENASPSVRTNIAQDLLDRGGHGAPKVIETRGFMAHLSGEDIERIKQRAKESGKLASGDEVDKERQDFIDAEFSETNFGEIFTTGGQR